MGMVFCLLMSEVLILIKLVTYTKNKNFSYYIIGSLKVINLKNIKLFVLTFISICFPMTIFKIF